MNLSNPSELKALLNRHGFSFSRSLGQNFLINEEVLDKIVSTEELNEDSCVLEVGPGAGVLTRRLAETGAKCVAVEIDKALLPVLSESMSGFENFKLINEDILKVDIPKLVQEEFSGRMFHVIANLPYYITTPIVMKLFEEGLPVRSMTLMVQKEVADRMCAQSGGKDYGALSVAVQYYSKPSLVCKAEPHCFIPQPKVASSVVHLKIEDEPTVCVNNKKLFFAVVKSAFSQRRKTLMNSLAKSPYLSVEKAKAAEVLEAMGLKIDVRGEKLSVHQFAEFANRLFD